MTDDPAAPPKAEGAGGRIVLVVLVVLALLVGGLWAGAHALVGDTVPRGASVSGVDVGGLAPAEAEQALAAALRERLRSPVDVVVDGSAAQVDPREAGITVDYAASVAATGAGETWDPTRLWDHVVGDETVDAVVEVDDAAMGAVVEELQGGLGTAPVDGAVRFTREGSVETSEPRPGRGLDPDAARDALVAAFLSGEPAKLGVTALPPDIDARDVARAVREVAEPAVAAPVVLRFGPARVRLAPREYAAVLGTEPRDGVLALTVDDDELAALVDRRTADAGDPVDARIEVVDDTPRVVLGRPGLRFSPGDVLTAFTGAVTAPAGAGGVRVAEVDATVKPPDFTTREARALGITDQVSEFTTEFPYAEYRNVNIGRAAELVDNTLLRPGQTFSMNDVVGERTRANGFTEGFVISNGIFAEDLGGGVSQMATTLFNAMFFAGLEDVEHKPHSFYIDRYPVGREATVAWGSVDLRFRNDTRHGVLVKASVTPSTPSSDGVVTVRMFSTPVWDIRTTTSDRYAYVSPATRVLRTSDCYPNSGYSGFQVDVARIFRRVGESRVARRETFHTDYTPSDTVVCRPPVRAP